ncbi:MAG: hypothetical protein LBG31_05105 [Prevotellaceae bacterium]|nr:hypothetical protein [Prevotellaceae bacterium]
MMKSAMLSGKIISRSLLFIAALFPAGKMNAQNHIKLVPLGVTYTNNTPTIKFSVGWNAVPNDNRTRNTKIWVWVDYIKVENHRLSGQWTRATITGVSAGTVEPGGKGFWLQGNAGAYSREVTATLSGTPSKFSWCVFASDAPPVAEFTASNSILFYGNAPFTVIYSDQSVAMNLPAAPYTPAAGKKIAAFTDATHCPGTVKYNMPKPVLSGGGSYCAASANLTCKGEAGVNYQLQKEGTATGGVKTGTGNVLTWTVQAAGSYTLSATHTATAATATGNRQEIILYREPAAPARLETNTAAVCHAVSTPATLTATGGSKGSGAVYEWGTGAIPGKNLLSPATTTAPMYAITPDNATVYWVRLLGNTVCKNATTAATVSIDAYAPFTAGAIAGDTTTTETGIDPNTTVTSSTDASGGGASISYQWRRSGTGSATLTGNAATYALNNDNTNYASPGTYYIRRYAKNDICDTTWTASGGQYTLIVENADPDQGVCRFTKPPVVGAFTTFPSTYSAATYVSLTDERDGKVYTVVKIGGRWVMAQNLNYQQDLTWNLISSKTQKASFWCPSVNRATTSALLSCNIWGALYAWETTMMVDGKWQDETRKSMNYPAFSCNSNNTNQGLGTDGRGICPPNWHVPTDAEWGELLNAMETGNKNHNGQQTGYLGTDAGMRGKSTCICDPNTSNCTMDTENLWASSKNATGTDDYNFRVLPAGIRYYSGDNFILRSYQAYFWTSNCSDTANAWGRAYLYDRNTVNRVSVYRTSGLSVRCMQN